MNKDLHYPFPEPPPGGSLFEAAPGVHWLRMPLPFSGLDHINLWLLEDGDAWTIVDCGLNSSKVRAHWEQIFAERLDGRPVRRVIATHFHPDHLGLAGWLVERWQAGLWMTRTEWLFGRMLSLDQQGEPPPSVIDFYRVAGLAEATIEMLRQLGFNNYRRGVSPIPERYRRIVDGETIEIGGRAWQVLVGRGHAPEHGCLYCAESGLLISGDQILPQISPHIGVYPGEPEANPLREYLASLPRFADLPDDTLVLPAHKLPFTGLARRVAELRAHHEERLEVLLAACERPVTVADTMPKLFRRKLEGYDNVFATGESLAHLNFLLQAGEISREVDGKGRYRYQRVDARDAA